MNSRSILLPVLIAILAGVVGCAGGVPKIAQNDTLGIEELRSRYADEDFARVVLGTGEFLARHPGSKFLDEALYLLARSHYEEGAYLEAEDGFRRLLRDFPETDFAEVSSYYLGLAILSQARGAELDQDERTAAHVQFRSFLSRYPESEYVENARGHIAGIRDKLAEKEYRNGITYTRVKAWRAARFYFEEKVWMVYPETPWAPRALLKLAETYRRGRDWNAVSEWAGRLIADYPDSESAAAARDLLDEATRKLEAAPPVSDGSDDDPAPR